MKMKEEISDCNMPIYIDALSDYVDILLEENSNLKKTISDLERENKNSFTSGYNYGFEAGVEHGLSSGYTAGRSACSNSYNENEF